MTTEILVFVPGTLGSELWDGQNRIWPGSLLEAVTGFSDQKFARLLQQDLEPRDIVRTAAGGLIGIYRDWIKAFEAIVRGDRPLFRETAGNGLPKTLHAFPYDWRVDLERTADALAEFLDAIVANTSDVDLKLVCHSQGGVLTRYYLESGRFDTRPAFERISLFVTFGAPHNGAPVAYAGAVGLHKAQFLSTDQTRLLANDARYPSLFQLFPSVTHSFIWHSDPTQASRSFPSDDAALARKFRLNQDSLAAWRSFRSGLTGKRPAHVRYFFVVGSREETLVRLAWDGNRLQKEELADGGDGTVSLGGAFDASTQTALVSKSHVSLIETRAARQTLASLFGATTVFSAAELAGRPTISVRDTVVTTTDEIYLQIEFAGDTNRLKSEIRFQRAVSPEDKPPDQVIFGEVASIPPKPIELSGPSFVLLNFRAPPIDIRGIYRPVLKLDGDPNEIVGPAFAVQEMA